VQPPRIALTTFGTTSMQIQLQCRRRLCPIFCDPQDHTLLVKLLLESALLNWYEAQTVHAFASQFSLSSAVLRDFNKRRLSPPWYECMCMNVSLHACVHTVGKRARTAVYCPTFCAQPNKLDIFSIVHVCMSNTIVKTHTHTYTHMSTHTCKYTLYTNTHTRTHTHTHTHTIIHTHNTYTRTHTCLAFAYKPAQGLWG
jgi:hypothetical protein